MKPPVLSRKLVLEERSETPDGMGGRAVSWATLGTLWADVAARTGREVQVAGQRLPRQAFRITVRGAPPGAPSRPRPDQRFREGARVYHILTVTELGPGGLYLECMAEEGPAA